MPPALPISSPPHAAPNAHLTVNRRRSVSRGSQGSAMRSSLGGKPIFVPRYGSTLSRGENDSAISDSEVGSASDLGLAARFGSFSVTREELRDGSARLASMSLANAHGFPSPDEPSLASSSAAASPFFRPSSPQYDQTTASSSAPSGLALGRPPAQYSQRLGIPSSETGVGSSKRLSPIASASTSPTMPLHSTPPPVSTSSSGADTPNALPTRDDLEASPVLRAIGLSTGSDERTPTPHMLLEQAERERRERLEAATRDGDEGEGEEGHAERGARGEPKMLGDESGGAGSDNDEDGDEALLGESLAGDSSIAVDVSDSGMSRNGTHEAHEETPLLGGAAGSKGSGRKASAHPPVPTKGVAARAAAWAEGALHKVREIKAADVRDGAKEAVTSIPAVILGTLMNILDAISYGMITFPASVPAFANFGGIGVSMFFVSCIVAQLVFSGGGSIFAAGNGSMMIEVVPFYHSIVGVLVAHIDDDETLVATTMMAFALSSILTGLAFGALGVMKLGRLSEFFPRHILVGTIGGVGAFLFVTGLQVSARLEEGGGISLELVRHFFDAEMLPLWTVPLALAILLRLITARFSHPLIFPAYFLAIPPVFYAITTIAGIPVERLRELGYVFEVKGVDNEWYEYLTHFNLRKTDWGALVETIPNQLALVFFGLLHVPINVPSLAISIGEDNVDTNRELVAHGISNVASGLLGSVPNYLVYVNSVLFIQNGGTTRISGFMLALGSVGILIAGPSLIGYLPVCVVAALIFILGIDLVKEAVWDTYHRVSSFEYATIWIIIVTMTAFDFTIGLAVGLILACVSFVIMSSQRRAIRSILTGASAHSTVRRHPKQQAFLLSVGRQIRVVKLQGFLFFGTISNVEATVRKMLDAASWSDNPIRFLVVDFSMASGVDFSAAEAFVRMQRLLDERGVVLVLCGCSYTSTVGVALRGVGLWTDGDEGVVVLENLNDALEHCENAFLRSLYSKTFRPPALHTQSGNTSLPLTSAIEVPKADLDSDIEGFSSSPRANQLRLAAKETVARPEIPQARMNFQQPLPILLQAFQPFSPDLNEDYCFRLVPYFKRVNVERGTTLWSHGSESDAFYVIESGMLRASYVFPDRAHGISESMVAGTVAGEMSFLSRTKRNANVVAERDSVLWRMGIAEHEELGRKEGWGFARRFEEVVLKISNAEIEVLMGHLLSSL
ncbi:Vsb1p [Rhodotorula paludigena]|uniref:Vsb1p n=1 Tax=Rhodotorula paludigena TaxID=86838 RepID=UPI0031767F17